MIAAKVGNGPRCWATFGSLLQRLQDACNSMFAEDRLSVAELFEEVGLGRLLEIRTRRRVERTNHREVLGAPAA